MPILKRVLSYLAAVVVAYLAILVLARAFENRLIYFPNYPGRLDGDWQPEGLRAEDVWLRTEDGVKIHAWWISAEGAEFTFVAFHGNAGNIAHRADIYRFLGGLTANVLAVEYRGYGRSEGRPHEQGLYLDARAAYDYLVRERKIPPERIIPFGQSLGTAIAADLAASRKVGGVVLEAPFASLRAIARRVYFFLPGVTLLMRTRFATGEKLAQTAVPLLVVHCSRDPVLAFALGKEVYTMARGPKFFFRIEGHCHEEAALFAAAEYRAQLLAFLERIRAAR